MLVDIQVCRVDKPRICRWVKNAVIDTRATVSAIPVDVAHELGITFPRRREFQLANGKKVARPIGAAVIRLEDRSAADDVITVPTGARATLSLCALGGMGYEVNPKTGRLKKLDAALLL